MFWQNKIISLPTYPNCFGMKQEPHIYFILALPLMHSIGNIAVGGMHQMKKLFNVYKS